MSQDDTRFLCINSITQYITTLHNILYLLVRYIRYITVKLENISISLPKNVKLYYKNSKSDKNLNAVACL